MLILTGNERCYSTTENLYRVRPGTNSKRLIRPPAVVPCYVSKNPKHSTARTPMARYWWDEYLKKLNGDKFPAAVHWGLAMFNNRTRPDFYGDEDGNNMGDKMESLLFAGNLVRAVPAGYGWMRVITLKYEDGPPEGMPTFDENPIFVQKFTTISRMSLLLSRAGIGIGKLFVRRPELYYPVVCDQDIFIQADKLEPWSKTMETEMPI